SHCAHRTAASRSIQTPSFPVFLLPDARLVSPFAGPARRNCMSRCGRPGRDAQPARARRS
ncbi:hypothetical protein, partial [Escherichia fergusonii]|uniref:hypothetical protein n=1 Tax=Escherichia fergusonii TaxID=564 RepID=UPI0021D87CAB